MIRSMTGFGSASGELGGGSVTVETRSVNSRHLKLSFRLAEASIEVESELRSLVTRRLSRGHVDIRVSVSFEGTAEPGLELDEARVEAYLKAVETLQRKYALSGQPDISLLLRFGNMLKGQSRHLFSEQDSAKLLEVAGRALDGLVEMREREGEQLETDLLERVAEIRKRLERTQALAPNRLRRERDRLRKAVEALTEGLTLDEDRLTREIALIAERWDLQEELVRAVGHLQSFEEYLDAPSEEPVGKRLAFLVQELHREINTIGSKANNNEISRHVVEMKNEIERLREQVENVE